MIRRVEKRAKMSVSRALRGLVLALVVMGAGSLGHVGAAYAREALTVTLSSNTLALNLMPHDSAGSFGSNSLDVSVSLNITNGYTLSIAGSDNTGNLVGQNNSSNVFSSITGTVSETDFSAAANTSYNGKWGYKVSKNSATNNNYVASPTTTPTVLDTVTNFSGTNNYTFTIGARANDTTPVDSYSATFVISAVSTIACNSTATSIDDAVCMQDMNDSVINSMVEGTQYRLMDNRDNKLYYIAKMKDGRVWMTQNLDLDLVSDDNATNYVELNHNNTDLGWTVTDTNAKWVPGATTATTDAGYGSNTSTAPASYDPGNIYYYYDKTTDTTTTYNNATTATADCNAAHNDDTCDHYHVGNYYNWSAAVASNDTSSITANYASANDSICPAGWRLPAGRTSTSSSNPGYYSEINYTWVNEGLATNYVTGSSGASWATDGFKNIRSSNMYMVAAGYKDGTSATTQTTTYSRYWTSTNTSSTAAYGPYFYSSNLYPAYNNSTNTVRGRGFSVRCVARQANTGSTTITFDKNAGDATGTMNTQSINANTLANLTSNSFTRTGYAFNSWNTEPDGSGRSYADAAQYYAKVGTATTNDTLYAQWDKVYTITFNVGSNADSIIFDGTAYTNGQTVTVIDGKSYVIGGNYPIKHGFNSWSVTAGTLENSNAAATNYTVSADATITLTGQEATTNMRSLTNPGSGSVSSTCKNDLVTPELVYDERDYEAYWVAVLCDGNYWMLDNLRLDLTSPTVINGLSSTNTNATDAQLAYLKGINTGTTTDQYPTAGLSGSEWTSSYSYSVPQVAARFKNNVSPVVFGLGSGKMGVYYNYCATSAGTYCWGNGTSSTGSPTTDPVANSYRDIEGDICPAGWRLPTGNSNSGTTRITDYGTLYATYSGASGGQALALRDRLSMSLSGYLSSGGSQSGLGTYGYFWSSTWYNASSMRHPNASTASASVTDYDDRRYGISIRCVLGSP